MGDAAVVSDPREEQLLSAHKSLQRVGAYGGWCPKPELCPCLTYSTSFL